MKDARAHGFAPRSRSCYEEEGTWIWQRDSDFLFHDGMGYDSVVFDSAVYDSYDSMVL